MKPSNPAFYLMKRRGVTPCGLSKEYPAWKHDMITDTKLLAFVARLFFARPAILQSACVSTFLCSTPP